MPVQSELNIPVRQFREWNIKFCIHKQIGRKNSSDYATIAAYVVKRICSLSIWIANDRWRRVLCVLDLKSKYQRLSTQIIHKKINQMSWSAISDQRTTASTLLVLTFLAHFGTMCPHILKPLLNLKFLSKSNQIKAEI